ncbi:MAG: hypothetical protein HQL27_01945 [Candidatus Omnitrophica bacterium]|nr:hypothetical protein [Candidatus Omnitrophota bacterium]
MPVFCFFPRQQPHVFLPKRRTQRRVGFDIIAGKKREAEQSALKEKIADIIKTEKDNYRAFEKSFKVFDDFYKQTE